MTASLILGLAWVVTTAKDEFVIYFMTDKEGVYVEELGGNLTALGNDLIETDLFLDGEDFLPHMLRLRKL